MALLITIVQLLEHFIEPMVVLVEKGVVALQDGITMANSFLAMRFDGNCVSYSMIRSLK